MKCRICDAGVGLHSTYRKGALEVSRLHVQPAESEGVEISLYACPVCGHYQISDINSEGYYDTFVLTASHSAKMQILQSEQARTLASLSPGKRHFIDIGCGDGSFLGHAAALFDDVLGVEPSRPYYELARQRGLTVMNEYLTEDLAFDHSFDAFASRQVFEHLTDPVKMLSVIHAIASEGAVGLIEVPNTQKILGESRYFDVFSDHINYFTPLSLCCLARRAAFEVISLKESFGEDYLELYVRKRQRVSTLEGKRDSDLAFLRESSRKYGTVSAWGAGSKAQAIMTALGREMNLKYIFDTDVHKHGKYVVNCRAPIVPPSEEKIRENDLIIIFGVSYQDEILGLLTNEFKYAGDILCLEGDKPCIVRT